MLVMIVLVTVIAWTNIYGGLGDCNTKVLRIIISCGDGDCNTTVLRIIISSVVGDSNTTIMRIVIIG